MKILKTYIVFACVLIFSACSDPFIDNTSESQSKIVVLKNWQYKINGTQTYSPYDTQRNADSINSTGWISITSLRDLPQEIIGKNILLKTKLPEWKGASAGIYIGQVNHFMQVFLNEKIIYQLGEVSSLNNTDILGWNQNLIQLPYYKKGETLTFLIWRKNDSISFEGNILLGPVYDIIKNMFIHNIDDLLFASIFLITGIIFFIIYFAFRKSLLLLGIAVYLAPLSIFIAVNSLFIQLIFPAPTLYYHLDYISFIISTVGGFFSIEQIIGKKYKKVLRYIWKIHFVFLIGSIIIILFTEITYLDILDYFLVVLSINMITCLVVMTLSLKKGLFENKILMLGMTIFMFSAFIEISYYLYGEWERTFSYSMKVLHFGVFFYVIALVWIVVYKYINTNKQKDKAQQKELEAVKRENEAREQFARRLIKYQENERNRIALELHDSIGQKLLLIKNQLLSKIRKETGQSSTEPLREICEITGEAIQEVRVISQNLRPQHLDQLGLTTAIETVIEKVAESSEIKFHINIDEIDELLPKEDEINFFRIVQESLNNIIKHSNATDTFINIKKTDNKIHMEIRDNGIGMMGNINTPGNGLGLTGMYERARMIGAKLDINFSDGTGTIVSMEYHF